MAVGAWQIMRTHDMLLAEAENDARNLALSLSQHAARTFEGVDLVLSGVTEQVESNFNQDRLKTFVVRSASHAAQISNLVVTNDAGVWIADAVGAHVPVNIADRTYFQWHRDHPDRALHVDATLESGYGGETTIPLTRRINNSDGSFGGIVVAALKPGQVQAFYQNVQVGKHGSVSLIADGQVLIRSPAAPDHTNLDPTVVAQRVKDFEAPSGIVRAYSHIDGVERIFAFEHVDRYPLVVSVGIAVDDVLVQWRNEASLQGIVIMLAASGLIAFGIGLDRHRRTALALAQASDEIHAQYRLLADNSSDVVTLRPSFAGRQSYVSPSCRSILGWEPDAFAVQPPVESIHPDDVECVAALFATLSPSNPRVTSRHRLRHHAGHYVRVESIFQVTGVGTPEMSIITTTRDITAKVQAEKARKVSETRYRMLADTTSDVILQLDLKFVQQYVSPASRTMLGYEPDEMLGVTPTGFIHPEDVPIVQSAMERLVAGEITGDRTTITNRMHHKQGHWVWLEAGINLIRDPKTAEPLSIICSLRDVTERQRAARHLDRAKAAAEQAVVAKAAFVANMSHELRTPLTGMLGIHDLLRRDPALDDAQKRLVGMASESGRSLLNIVNDILDFSKIEACQLTIESVPFDLRVLVETCQVLASEGIKGKPVDLTVHFGPGEFKYFIGDPGRVQQVLLNLLTNAAKFTECGTVTVGVDYRLGDGTLRFAVTDTGMGIPDEKLPLLFERFSQADASTARRYGGTGLGLAISKHLVELMGGRIGVDTRLGEGSCFWFELALPTLNGLKTPASGAELPSGHGRLRILLAEDNTINQEVIAAMIASRGHAVVAVSDGAAAVEAMRAGSPFDIVLMDLQMPGMDGLTATGVLRDLEEAEDRRRLPVLGLTANALDEDVACCLEAGMDGHVAKPIHWPTLFQAIDRAVSTARERVLKPVSEPRNDDDILDAATLGKLERVIGRERLGKMLAAFAEDVERRLTGLTEVTPSALSAQAHTLMSSAGQFGFHELSKLCVDIECEAREGGGLWRITELKAAAARASSVARSQSWARSDNRVDLHVPALLQVP